MSKFKSVKSLKCLTVDINLFNSHAVGIRNWFAFRNQQSNFLDQNYRKDLEKQEGCVVVAHERLNEPRVTME